MPRKHGVKPSASHSIVMIRVLSADRAPKPENHVASGDQVPNSPQEYDASANVEKQCLHVRDLLVTQTASRSKVGGHLPRVIEPDRDRNVRMKARFDWARSRCPFQLGAVCPLCRTGSPASRTPGRFSQCACPSSTVPRPHKPGRYPTCFSEPRDIPLPFAATSCAPRSWHINKM